MHHGIYEIPPFEYNYLLHRCVEYSSLAAIFFLDRREMGEFSEFPTVPDSPKFLGCRPRTTFTGGSARARERRAPSATRVAFLTRRTQKKKTETTSNLLFFYLSPVIVDTTAAPALYVVAQ